MKGGSMVRLRDDAGRPLPQSGPPHAWLEVNSAGSAVEVAVSGDIGTIRTATGGSAALLQSLVFDMVQLPGRSNVPVAFGTDADLAFVEQMEPRDPAEAAFLVQVIAIHRALINTAHDLAKARSQQEHETYEKSLNRLARTSAAQLEALRSYRNRGQQTVRVERVTVEAGGQAVVGHVETNKGRGR